MTQLKRIARQMEPYGWTRRQALEMAAHEIACREGRAAWRTAWVKQ